MKEKINTVISIFTRFSTVIFVLDSIALLAFKGKEAKLYVTDILFMLGIALFCALLYTLLLSDKNYSKKKMFLMQLIYILIIDVIVLAIGLLLNWISFCNIKTVFVFESVIIVVCLVTICYSYKLDSFTAKKMNEKLKSLSQENKK